MDRVSSVDEFQGWREAKGEELQVIQGCFLKDAQLKKQNTKISNVIFGVFTILCLMGAISILEFIIATFRENEIADTVFLSVILIGLLFIAVAFIKIPINSYKRKTSDKLFDAIYSNKFRVNDVEIVEVTAFLGLGDGPGGHEVKVKDMYGNYCDEDIFFVCHNGYQKTGALLVDIPILENGEQLFCVQRVIPCKEFDPVLWNIGLKNYNKYVNKKLI